MSVAGGEGGDEGQILEIFGVSSLHFVTHEFTVYVDQSSR